MLSIIPKTSSMSTMSGGTTPMVFGRGRRMSKRQVVHLAGRLGELELQCADLGRKIQSLANPDPESVRKDKVSLMICRLNPVADSTRCLQGWRFYQRHFRGFREVHLRDELLARQERGIRMVIDLLQRLLSIHTEGGCRSPSRSLGAVASADDV